MSKSVSRGLRPADGIMSSWACLRHWYPLFDINGLRSPSKISRAHHTVQWDARWVYHRGAKRPFLLFRNGMSGTKMLLRDIPLFGFWGWPYVKTFLSTMTHSANNWVVSTPRGAVVDSSHTTVKLIWKNGSLMHSLAHCKRKIRVSVPLYARLLNRMNLVHVSK